MNTLPYDDYIKIINDTEIFDKLKKIKLSIQKKVMLLN
jgi:hypothetical protein